MKWLKHATLDLVVTGAILVTALQSLSWLEILLTIYAALLVFLKFFSLLNEGILKRIRKGALAAPDWFYHLLYAINVTALAATQRWVLGLLWLLIWLLSWQTSRKLRNLPQPVVAKRR
ncbi:MAG: hypothetical protein ACREOO_22305 [bacterium]